MSKPHNKFKNQIRAARNRMALALNSAGYTDVKRNSKITTTCTLYASVFNVPLLKDKKYWEYIFLLDQYSDLNSNISKSIKIPKKVNRRLIYNAYIKSHKWFIFSSNVKKERGNKCEECSAGGKGIILHAHHLTYERLGNELPEDIQVLCKSCHQLKHPDKKFR